MSHLNYYIGFPLFLCLGVFVCLFFCPGDGTWGFLHARWACYFGDTLTGPFVVLYKVTLKGGWDERFFFFLIFTPPIHCNWKLKSSSLQNPVLVQNLSLEDHCFFSGSFHVVGIAFLRRKSAWASWMCFSENQDKKILLYLSVHTRWGVHLLFSFRGRLFRWSQ